MNKQIAADEPLDYVEFRISPDDRYYVFICSGDKEEKIGSPLIGQLTAHLNKDLYSDSEGSYANFKLELPENLCNTTWFTKTTLTRFLELTESPDALKKIFAIRNEMFQLEETKKFHLSLHCQEKLYRNNLMNDEADNCNSNGSVQTPKQEESDSSDNSKNELLRAMDLRLTALGDELVAAFEQAVGSTCSSKETLNLEKFCKHFGAADVSNVICKLLGMNLIAIVSDPPHDKKLPAECDFTDNKLTINAQISKSSNIDQAIRYGASPAKAAELERRSSSDSEDLSCSSEEEEVERPSAERSRNMTRSATPRRSASPMRRIQIGRSGSRRTPAIAIKSLTYFPGRESRDKTFYASNDGETDRFELPTRAAESNDRRMSVQDAISLFERKQRDQTTEAPKWKSPADNPANAPKAVLRRWSSSVGETSAQRLDQDLPATSSDLLDEAPSAGVQPNTDILPCPPESETAAEASVKLETSEQSSPSPNDVEIPVTYSEGAGEKIDSAEWSRKKEAELNQMLSSFVQSKPSKYRSTQAADSKKLDSRTGQNKERKNQKLPGENIGKKTDKRAQPRTMPKAVLDKTKPEISLSNIGKKQPVTVSKTQKEKVAKSMPLTSNSKRESPRPAVSKVPSKLSPLPATRKSWPLSTPTPRAIGTLSSKALIGGTPTSGTSVPRQKSQSPAPLSRSTPKPETPQQKKKDVRNMQVETKKSSRSIDENKGKVKPKSMITKKTGVVASADTVPAKPTSTRKAAKKSSVVPLEPKPSLRRGSGASSKKAHASPVKQPSSKPEVAAAGNPVCIQDNEVDANNVSESVIEEVVQEEAVDLQPESHVSTPIATADVKEASDRVPAKLVDERIERVTESSGEKEIQPEEESLISPLAWVENGLQDSPSTCQVAPPAAAAANLASSRVRHSLSQMLLEESSEPDTIEWGNAENPPAMVYQKDAPKGLKRLLKFARKSRGETTNIGSSPYASEGEDDGDESKGFGRKNSDNLLRKAALNATQHGQYGISADGHEKIWADSEPLSARSNASNTSFQSTTSATSRASRSFFSLSAFRGNKGTETKMR